jgi:hypothetical protein
MARYLYSELSRLIQARKTSKPEWAERHTDTIESLVKEHMPSGSGFDSGTKIDLDASHAEKLVFYTSFHHLNGQGFYDGWTEHTVTVTPSLSGDFHLRISGRNRNEIKDHMYQSFEQALRTEVTYDLYQEHFPELRITSKWEDENGQPSQSQLAFYVGDKRFHSSDKTESGHYEGSPLDRARIYAGNLMYEKFMRRGQQ